MKRLTAFIILLFSSLGFGQNYIDSYPQAETIKDTMIFIIDYDTTGSARYTRKVYWVDLKNNISAAAQDSSFTSIQFDTANGLSGETMFFYSDQIAQPLLHVISDQNGSIGSRQIFHLNTTTPADGDLIFSQFFQTGATPDVYGHYDWYIDDASSSAQDGKLQTWLMRDGSEEIAIELDSLGVHVPNGQLSIGNNPSAVSSLFVGSETLSSPIIVFGSDQDGSIGPLLALSLSTDTPAPLDQIANIQFNSTLGDATTDYYARLRGLIADTTNNAEDGQFLIDLMVDGSQSNVTKFDSVGLTQVQGNVIISSGDLGVGTTPSYAIHIQDTAPVIYINDTNGISAGYTPGSITSGYLVARPSNTVADNGYVSGLKALNHNGQFLGSISIIQNSVTGPDGEVVIHTTSAGDGGATERMRIAHDGGVTIGSPTGGSQGAGTINATAIYDDGVLISGGGADSTFEKISANTLDDNGSGQIFVNSNLDVGGDSGSKIRVFSEGGETSGQGTITITLDTLILSNDNNGTSPKLIFSNNDLVNTGWLMRMNSLQDLHIFANTSNTERVDIQNIGSGKADLNVEGDVDLGGTLDANLVRATQVMFDTAKALSSQILSFRSDTTVYLYDNGPRFGIGALPVDGTALHIYSDEGIFAPRVRLTSDHDGTLGASFQYFLDTASPASSDIIGITTHKSRDSGTNETDYVSLISYIDDPTGGSEDGKYVVNVMKAGSQTDILQIDNTGASLLNSSDLNVAGAIIVGSPTGGDQGDGTINAEAVYDDGSILSDYVFTEEYQEEMLSIAEMDKFIKRHKHLPTIPGKKTWEEEGRPSLGKLLTQVYETVENQALYIIQLEQRISELENRKN